ncbi:er membrane protein complex subunit 2-like [Nannochloropsis oceanica]
MEGLDQVLKQGDSTAVLKYIRHHRIRASTEVVQHGRDFVMEGKGSSLGDEAWPVYEQVFLAALDLGETLLAETSLRLLQKKFPDSARVGRLEGMICEAEGDFEQAAKVYLDLRERYPTDPVVWKRWVALAKAEGDLPEAIKRCNEYLKVFQGDTSAWQELAALYVRTGHLHEAAFCYEELVLCSPANFAFHVALAEAYVGIGGGESLRLARKHYAQAMELHGGDDNLRALYGMCATCHALARSSSSASDETDSRVNAALFNLAGDKLKEHYTRANPALFPFVEATLSRQAADVC